VMATRWSGRPSVSRTTPAIPAPGFGPRSFTWPLASRQTSTAMKQPMVVALIACQETCRRRHAKSRSAHLQQLDGIAARPRLQHRWISRAGKSRGSLPDRLRHLLELTVFHQRNVGDGKLPLEDRSYFDGGVSRIRRERLGECRGERLFRFREHLAL